MQYIRSCFKINNSLQNINFWFFKVQVAKKDLTKKQSILGENSTDDKSRPIKTNN